MKVRNLRAVFGRKEEEEEIALTLLPDEEDSVAAEVGAGEERGWFSLEVTLIGTLRFVTTPALSLCTCSAFKFQLFGSRFVVVFTSAID